MSNRNAILITGARGFIGRNACEFASKYLDLDVYALDIKECDDFLRDHCYRFYQVDIRNRERLIEVFDEIQPTYVLHLAAGTGMDVKELDQLSANIDGVKSLIDSAKACGTVRRVLFTSSLLVCKNGYIPQNSDDYCPPNLYGTSKMIGEKIVKEAGLPFEWSIVRPTSIWGPWFEYSYRTFFQTIDKGIYVHINGHDVVKPKSYVGNTVYMMFKILLCPTSIVDRQTYYLSDWPETTTHEWAEEIRKQLRARPIHTVPLSLLRVGARLGDLIKFMGIDPPLSSFRLSNMLTGGSYPIENTKEIVGELPFTLKDGVQETIRWMLQQGLIRSTRT